MTEKAGEIQDLIKTLATGSVEDIKGLLKPLKLAQRLPSSDFHGVKTDVKTVELKLKALEGEPEEGDVQVDEEDLTVGDDDDIF